MMLATLVLGGGRYLDMSGEVVPAATTYSPADVEVQRSMDPGFDPDRAGAPGSPAVLTDENRAYWEKIARNGGHTLDELIAPQL